MDKFKKLTQRELEVLALVINGLDNGHIANKLFITKDTVKMHMSSIYKKTDIHSRVTLAIEAYKASVC